MPRFGVHEVADVTLYSLKADGSFDKPTLYLDSLKMSTLENEAETSYASGGKGGGRILTWDFNRTARFNIQNALLDPKALAIQAGLDDVSTSSQTLFKREILTVTDSGTAASVVASHAPITGTVTVINSAGTSLTVSSVSSTTINLDTAQVANLEKVTVYYQFTHATGIQAITISADKFPGFYAMVGDTVVRNETSGKDEPFQIILPKIKLMPGFTINLQPDGDPTIFDFNVEVYQNTNKEMVKMIRYTV